MCSIHTVDIACVAARHCRSAAEPPSLLSHFRRATSSTATNLSFTTKVRRLKGWSAVDRTMSTGTAGGGVEMQEASDHWGLQPVAADSGHRLPSAGNSSTPWLVRQPNLRGGLQRPFRAFGWSHAGAASPATLGKFRCSLVGPLTLWAM